MKMNFKDQFANSKAYYITGALLILTGITLVNIIFSVLDYSIIGIGIVIFILGVNETIKSL